MSNKENIFSKSDEELMKELISEVEGDDDDCRIIPLNKELHYKRMNEIHIQELNKKEHGYGFFDEGKDMSVKLGFKE
jgi:hypothetical protein